MPRRERALHSPAAVSPLPSDLDLYANDPARWGHSMAHLAELVLACLDAAGARSVAEVGAFAGDLTRVLVDWGERSQARVLAIDPAPKPQLVALAERHPGLELLRETSLDALPQIDMPDAVVIDGDHNWWTVTEELRLLAARVNEGHLPLLIFHDVLWPHGRRDDYFDAGSIPADARHPVVQPGRGIAPGEAGARPGGLPYPHSAAREGGPRNGVLTAVEDFAENGDGLRLVVVPAFFGLGVLWHRDAAWSDTVAQLLDPWDRNPVLARMEANRVHHIAAGWAMREVQQRAERQERVLARLLESSAFSVTDLLSRLRVRAGVAPNQAAVSKEEVRRALER